MGQKGGIRTTPPIRDGLWLPPPGFGRGQALVAAGFFQNNSPGGSGTRPRECSEEAARGAGGDPSPGPCPHSWGSVWRLCQQRGCLHLPSQRQRDPEGSRGIQRDPGGSRATGILSPSQQGMAVVLAGLLPSPPQNPSQGRAEGEGGGFPSVGSRPRWVPSPGGIHPSGGSIPQPGGIQPLAGIRFPAERREAAPSIDPAGRRGIFSAALALLCPCSAPLASSAPSSPPQPQGEEGLTGGSLEERRCRCRARESGNIPIPRIIHSRSAQGPSQIPPGARERCPAPALGLCHSLRPQPHFGGRISHFH